MQDLLFIISSLQRVNLNRLELNLLKEPQQIYRFLFQAQ